MIRRLETYAEEYADPLVQARGNPLTLRSAALAAYTALEDEERRPTGKECQVIHPHALHVPTVLSQPNIWGKSGRDEPVVRSSEGAYKASDGLDTGARVWNDGAKTSNVGQSGSPRRPRAEATVGETTRVGGFPQSAANLCESSDATPVVSDCSDLHRVPQLETGRPEEKGHEQVEEFPGLESTHESSQEHPVIEALVTWGRRSLHIRLSQARPRTDLESEVRQRWMLTREHYRSFGLIFNFRPA
jgi:hypothetical protein